MTRRSRAFAIARLAATLGLLCLVVWRVDAREVRAQLGRLDARFVAVFLLCSVPLYLLQAWRWHFTAARIGAPLRFRRAWCDYYLSTLLNQLLPLGVAGDVVRAARHRGRLTRVSTEDGAAPSAWGAAARAVVLERFSGVVALALLVGVSALVWLLRGRAVVPGMGLAVLLVLAAFAAWMAFGRAQVAPWLALFATDARRALVEPRALGFQLAVSTAALLLLVAMFVCAGRATGVALSLLEVVEIVPLVFACTTVPWAFAGWGVRELSTAALCRLVGLDAAAGVAVSITFGLLSLAAAAPGLLVLALPQDEAP